MTHTARGTFEITLVPGPGELGGAVQRLEFDKTFTGALDGTSRGILLSAGDPASGEAGYVAIESFTGRLDGRAGGFVFLQLGRLTGGEQTLHYDVAPGSGTGDLAGIVGRLDLRVADGIHHYELDYELP